jgi:hypothetical protein
MIAGPWQAGAGTRPVDTPLSHCFLLLTTYALATLPAMKRLLRPSVCQTGAVPALVASSNALL